MEKKVKLTYVYPSSMVDPNFWNKLTELKLDVDRLDETERPLWGYIHLSKNDTLPTLIMEVDSSSFDETPKDIKPPAHISRANNKSKTQGPRVPQADRSKEKGKFQVLGVKVPQPHSSGENNKSKLVGPNEPGCKEENYKASINDPQTCDTKEKCKARVLNINVFPPHSYVPNNKLKTVDPDVPPADCHEEKIKSKTLDSNVPRAYRSREKPKYRIYVFDFPDLAYSSGANNNSKTPSPDVPKTLGPDVPETLDPDVPKTLGPDVIKTLGPDVPQTLGPDVPKIHDPDVPKIFGPDVRRTFGPKVPQAHCSRANKVAKTIGPTNCEFNGQNFYVPFYGKIVNKNTFEQFKECNKLTFIRSQGAELYKKIVSGEALEKPAILNCFAILTYADLKEYIFRFWFAFPVLRLKLAMRKVLTNRISNVFKDDERSFILNEFLKLDKVQRPFFLVSANTNSGKKEINLRPLTELKYDAWKLWSDIYFGFFDISIQKKTVGSQIRNYVALIVHYCPDLTGTEQKFLALRCEREKDDSPITIEQSSIYKLKLPKVSEHDIRSCIGWEKSSQDQDNNYLGPKLANMRTLLDPLKLADTSVDFHLKLMKWRAVPDIDLEKIKNTKCLLLGSGTLGCSVARSLLAWGVRYITFVDNSTVSFSNPARQSLFTYEDAVKMRSKAKAAAERLKQIVPGVRAKGVHLTIPMPGHGIGPSMVAEVTSDIKRLIHLFKYADIIFLLTDSRESRWLPTMLGNYFGKTVINAAVGFDSYVVMRHGYKNDLAGEPCIYETNGYKIIEGHNLGCYFCNDVIAPGYTMGKRTLDQQCTVTRPGIPQIASALAVELAVSILQHKEDRNASAFYKRSNQEDEDARDSEAEYPGLLGLVPHSIRGFLPCYEQVIPATLKYDQCVACSDYILDEYQNRGIEFLLQVFNRSEHLEGVTKLTDLFSDIDSEEVLVIDDASSDWLRSDDSYYSDNN